jgi:phosphoglycerate dehydrogenase-like enzyme
MSRRPRGALAMWPGVEDRVLDPTSRARLAELVDLIDERPVDLRAPDDRLADVEVLVGSWGCPVLDADSLANLPRLRLLAYAAGTVKGVVTDATWERGVAVSSAAAANAVPVAEFTFAAVVMIAKDVFRIRDRHRELRGQEWVQGTGPGREVGTRGLRVGVIGASRIGRLVIERLRTLDCSIAVSDPHLRPGEATALGATELELDELFAWADIVSVHAPALPSTHHLVDARRLALLHDGAWLINTARGSLVDTTALEHECVSGRLCALIDTADPEPFPPGSPLYDLANVVLTPHIAGSLGTEISRMGDLAVDEVRRFLEGEPLLHEVTASDIERIA